MKDELRFFRFVGRRRTIHAGEGIEWIHARRTMLRLWCSLLPSCLRTGRRLSLIVRALLVWSLLVNRRERLGWEKCIRLKVRRSWRRLFNRWRESAWW